MRLPRLRRPAPCLRPLRDRTGGAVVELGLAISLLLLLVAGVVEVGRGVHVYLTVLQATEQAALLSTDPGYSDAAIVEKLRGWASPLELSSASVTRYADRTEVRAGYGIPINVTLLRTALQRDSIPMATLSVAPPAQ